jgi:hypothetical protein
MYIEAPSVQAAEVIVSQQELGVNAALVCCLLASSMFIASWELCPRSQLTGIFCSWVEGQFRHFS